MKKWWLVFFFVLIFFIVFVLIFISLNQSSNNLNKPLLNKNPQGIKSNDPVIVAAGDISCGYNSRLKGECRQMETSDLILKINPDAVLIPGDIQYDNPTISKYNEYFDKSWGRFKEKIYPTSGNHEYDVVGASFYFEYFGQKAGEKTKGYYSFDIGNWHIIALNSNCWAAGGCEVSSQQGKWLEDDLEKNTKKCTLSFFHHPLFTSGQREESQFVNDFWKILYTHGVDVIINGHNHLYERYFPLNPDGKKDEKGTREFVVGTGGKSLYRFIKDDPRIDAKNNTNFGVLKLILHENSYTYEFIPIDSSNFRDAGVFNCN